MIRVQQYDKNGSEEREGDATFISAAERRDLALIQSFKREYVNVHRITGLGDSAKLRQTVAWVDKTKPTYDPKEENNLKSRLEFFKGYGGDIIKHGKMMHQLFFGQMEKASSYISRQSYERWVRERFLNDSIGFYEKKYWIEKQMPTFVENWIKVGKERDVIMKDERLADAMRNDPELAVLKNREAFLDLHFDKKRCLLSQAHAAMLSLGKQRAALYAQAKVKLAGAVSERILPSGKVGTWLLRIFKPNVSIELIDHFVNGSGLETMDDLMQNWYAAKHRYDHIKKEIQSGSEAEAARGFTLLSEQQFLNLHYDARMSYVEEAERRIGEVNDVETEHPIFTQIKHAMDTRDWEGADSLIVEARSIGLSGKDLERLNSMDSFVKQFSGRKESTEGMQNVTETKNRIDQIMHEMSSTHSDVQSMIMRLMRGPNANRSIHQFRWIVYNNKWCRTHGYLNHDISRKGASKENQELTKLRARNGEDIGRNDVLSGETGSAEFIRKEEDAKNKATLLHVDMSDGAAKSAVASKMEKEQNASMLYWMTFCGNEKGEPKSDNWHNDLFVMLTELRSHARTLKGSGFMYDGPGRPLIGMN